MKTNAFISRILPLKDNLLRVAFRITGNAELAEEVVQEAMLKIWEQRTSWVVIEDLPAYCLMLTRNIALQKVPDRTAGQLKFTVGS